jgi:hypothetical protein
LLEVTHRLRRGIVVTGDDCIAIDRIFCGIHLLALLIRSPLEKDVDLLLR